ncbi:MAG: type II toxin-antitoxin system VapC family toxin [Chloroflexota bacterium]
MVVVIDASALLEMLLRTEKGPEVLDAIHGSEMVAPDLINIEVLAATCRLARIGEITAERAWQVISDLRDAPVRRFPTARLIKRVWLMRQNVTAYDAAYAALAEVLDCILVTSDLRLARAPKSCETRAVV